MRLSSLQAEILRSLSNPGPTNASDLARRLNRKQPTIFNSVRSLLKNNYLDSGQYGMPDYKLVVADKGSAAISTLSMQLDRTGKDASYHSLDSTIFSNYMIRYMLQTLYRSALEKSYYSSPRGQEEVRSLKKMLSLRSNKGAILNKASVYASKNDYFNNENFGKFTKRGLKKLKLLIALEFANGTVDLKTLREFVHKSGADKDTVKRCLKKQKLYIESAIRELD
jgi:hypothetical protein